MLELKTQLNKIFGEPLKPVTPGKIIQKYLYDTPSLGRGKHTNTF